MCGIAGFCRPRENWNRIIKKMTDKMVSRGPDGSGEWCEEGILALGHRRLAIFDLSNAGAQPMQSHDGRWIITYNGEIYNYLTLKRELQETDSTLVFKSSTDTEVLVEGFAKWGVENTLNKICGMYAIALYDKYEKKLYLIRDRIGEKPLYYGRINGELYFASDLRALMSVDGFDKRIDNESIALLLKYHYIPAPYTIFANYKKLSAGEMLVTQYPFKESRIERYYSINEIADEGEEKIINLPISRSADELEKTLQSILKEQMQADVPVGVFLSGGIDSSLVAALACQVSTNVETFTVGFEKSKVDESVYAKQIAKHLGTRHHEIFISEEKLLDAILKSNNVFSEPFANYSGLPTALICEEAKKYVTVCVGGDGGDEIFGGYDQYLYAAKWGEIVNSTPTALSWVLKKVYDLGIINNSIYSRNLSYYTAKNIAELYYIQQRYDTLPRFLNADMYHDTMPQNVYSSNEFFVKGNLGDALLADQKGCMVDCSCYRADMAGMHNSLEVRSPLLDKRVIEASWRIPEKYKFDQNRSKIILREILYKYVPKELIERPKQPFWFPANEWLAKGRTREWAEALLYGQRIKKLDCINLDEVNKAWNQFVNNGKYDAQLWAIIELLDWLETNSVA